MIKAYDPELPESNLGRPRGSGASRDIRDFLDSKSNVVEIDVSGKKNIRNTRNTYSQMASRMGLSGAVMVSMREGRLFLIRKKEA